MSFNDEDEKKVDIKHVETLHKGGVDEARAGTEAQKQMSFKEAVRMYPAAIGWSVLLSTAIIMEGYDTQLLNSFWAYPAFQRKFGDIQADGSYMVSAKWQTALGMGTNTGSIIGLLINGYVSDRFGYKKTLQGALLFMTCALFIPFFAPSVEVLLFGQLMQGLPWGVFQTLTTAYASEICPVALRAYLTTYVNACWVIGQLICAGVLRGLLSNKTQWGYRIPFALQWIWPIPILIGSLWAPESPWWLIRKGRVPEARAVLLRLTNDKNVDYDPDAQVAMMVHTNELEKSMSSGTSYLDCFKKTDRRRTEIACVVWMAQNWCGSALMGWSSTFLIQSGLPTDSAYSLQLGQSALGLAGTISAWFLMGRFGRRTLYLYGLVGLVTLLIVIGSLGTVKDKSKTGWAIGALLLVFTLIFDLTIGPVCYCLVAEISSTRLRAKTIALARITYNLVGMFGGVVTPYMLNPTSGWGWGAKTAFFWLGTCSVTLVWTFFRLPEPKGRTYGELDVLFEQRVSARKFATTHVDQYADVGEHSARANAGTEAKMEEVTHGA